MRLIAKVVMISRDKFYCNRLTTVQCIQDYASLIFFSGTQCTKAGLPDCQVVKQFVLSRFDTIPACDGRTDRQTRTDGHLATA